MTIGMNAVLAALDAAPTPVRFFLRDDDAGWDDARLFALLDCVAACGAPIDLAVIPRATHAALATELRARVDATPFALGLHQHGFAHTNHETEGRKCEFGSARDVKTQRYDLIEGRNWLQHCFAARLDPIFTPPWNRCAVGTPSLLAELGFAALSRDVTAPAQAALPEIAVQIDWCKLRPSATNGDVDGEAALAAELVRAIGSGECVGVMLHHAAMDESDLATLKPWLSTLQQHPRAHWMLMRELLCVDHAAHQSFPSRWQENTLSH